MKNIILISIILILLLNTKSIAKNFPNIPKQIDVKGQTFCDKDGRKFGHAIILLDVTSELGAAQINFVKNTVFSKDFYLGFDPFTKFSYLMINNKSVQTQEFVFSKCRPKSGEDSKLEKNSLNENKKYLERYYNDFLSDALLTSDKYLKNKLVSEASLIYETVAYIFQNPKFDFSEKVGRRDLIIVSDMMQNSERINFYKACNYKSPNAQCPSFSNFMKNLSDKDYLIATAPKGKDVNLKIIYLNNRYETNKEIDKSLIELWKNYFIDRGFQNVEIIRFLDIR
jgi:hypothetical protein